MSNQNQFIFFLYRHAALGSLNKNNNLRLNLAMTLINRLIMYSTYTYNYIYTVVYNTKGTIGIAKRAVKCMCAINKKKMTTKVNTLFVDLLFTQ